MLYFFGIPALTTQAVIRRNVTARGKSLRHIGSICKKYQNHHKVMYDL